MTLTQVYDIKINGDFSIIMSLSYIERNMILLALEYYKNSDLKNSKNEIKNNLLLFSTSFQNHNVDFDNNTKKALIIILEKYTYILFKKGIQNMYDAFNEINQNPNSLNYKNYNPLLKSITLNA